MGTVANEACSKRDRRQVAALAAMLSFAASITTLVCLAGLHVLSPEFDPSWRVVSEYALGRHAWALSLMFLAWGMSSWALAFAIRSQVRTLGGQIGLVFLVVAGLGQALASVFDLRQPVPHNLAGALGIPTLPIAAMLISVSLGRMQLWRPSRKAMLAIAGLTWVSLVVMVAAIFSLRPRPGLPRVPIGWPNRFLIVIYCTWAMFVAWRAIGLGRRNGDGKGWPDDLAAEATAGHRSALHS
jgi:Protein of unknown function (DUF998)